MALSLSLFFLTQNQIRILNPQRSFLCFIQLALGNFYCKLLQENSSVFIKTKWFETKQRQDSIPVLCQVSLLCLLIHSVFRGNSDGQKKR